MPTAQLQGKTPLYSTVFPVMEKHPENKKNNNNTRTHVWGELEGQTLDLVDEVRLSIETA